jgi:hypothetical protein
MRQRFHETFRRADAGPTDPAVVNDPAYIRLFGLRRQRNA